MKIGVIGLGYVGLPLAVLLSRNNKVFVYDTNKKILNQIENKDFFSNEIITKNHNISVRNFFADKRLDINPLYSLKTVIESSEILILALPTDLDKNNGTLNTSVLENVLKEICKMNFKGTIVIKSTIPIGFCDKMENLFPGIKIFFLPEFLREGHAYEDNLYPDRLVIGVPKRYKESYDDVQNIRKMLEELSAKKTQHLVMSNKEAEAVKLFSNAYIAMRVAYFNEIDTFCDCENISTKNVIVGVSADQRIGNFYNNPSFGYGGYCLPKDSKELQNAFQKIPESLITAIVASNNIRKNVIVQSIVKYLKQKAVQGTVIGIYRLIMKSESDNFRESAILDIISLLQKEGYILQIYEPILSCKTYRGIKVETELYAFKKSSTLILTNRLEDELLDVKEKVYTRDIFKCN